MAQMKSFKTWHTAMVFLGLIFIGIGWWYTLPYPVSSNVAELVFRNRAIKSGIFFGMGFTFIFISFLFNLLVLKIKSEMNALKERIHQLERHKAAK
jgi:threonine/homoserine/homoserine lactone efflux protein